MQELLRAVTSGSVHSAHLKITGGNSLAKHHVECCIFVSEKCTSTQTKEMWLARQQFENGLRGVDFAEAWVKDRNEFRPTSRGAVEHPSVFANRLGCTEDFNSSDLHRTKVKDKRKASFPVRLSGA